MGSIIESLKSKYSGKKVLVVGLGLQGGGAGVAKFFVDLGAIVTVTDKKDEKALEFSINQLANLQINFHLGGHILEDFLQADVIFKGPVVSWSLPEIVEAEKQGIPVEMELSFFAEHCPAKIIGVTGTRGKSTTTYMIYTLLKENGYSVHLSGSIPGVSTIALLKAAESKDWIVMELPSWPLSGFHRKKISPHIGVFTNMYPDHLNFYSKMDEYLWDKKAVYLYQTQKDHLVANRQLEAIIQKDQIRSKITYFQALDFPYEFKYLKGEHNKENAAAALSVSRIAGVNEKKAIESISGFKGLPYRQEIVGEKDHVIFVNDTTSTTPIATIKAIEAFGVDSIVLLLGGNSKRLPFETLFDVLEIVKHIVLLKGSFTDEILPLLEKRFAHKISEVYDDLEMAVKKAYELAKANGPKKTYVLFSPSATSFAMFNNEFHRGEIFNKIVREILNSES